jgi:hypothetical protein
VSIVSTETTTDGGEAPGASSPAREADVPPGAPVHECEYCGRPFATASYLALHRGIEHRRAVTDAEWAAYEDALDEEDDDVRRFRIVALGMLVLVYFGFLFAYAAFA